VRSYTSLDHTPSLRPISRLAEKYDLHPVYKKEFHEVFEEFQEHPEFKPLLQRMKVVDANGETEMNEDQWEAASTSFLLASCVLFADWHDRHLHRLCNGKTLNFTPGGGAWRRRTNYAIVNRRLGYI
jgi:hypothetical protein